MRDPMRPVTILAVEEDPDHLLVMSNGYARSSFHVVLDPDDVGRMKAGYVCAICFEPHEQAWPEECNACRFPMKHRQAEYLAKAYKGNTRIGPSTSMADELGALEELEEKQARERTVSAPQIVVPRSW